jgi:hypothetical protein
MIDGNEILEQALESLEIDLASLIASASIWANPEVFSILKSDNSFGTYYPNTRRYKKGKGEEKGEIINGIRLDDNTYANFAIKKSIGHDREAPNFMTCHIWPDTCYDHRYHTCIANIVLIPKAISGLSDHDSLTIRCLKYRSFELYGWHPQEENKPTKPDNYPEFWRDPLPITDSIRRAINNRR